MNDIIALVQYLSEPAARGSEVARKEAPREREVDGCLQRLSRQAAGRSPARPARARFKPWMCRLAYGIVPARIATRFSESGPDF